MSRHQTIRTIRGEIERLNHEIDLKIIKGISYARESKRHQMLKAQLSEMSPRFSWLGRSMSFLSSFVL
jgi:hypothetical protein